MAITVTVRHHRGPPAHPRFGSNFAGHCTRSLRLLRRGHWWPRSHASCSLTRANPALRPRVSCSTAITVTVRHLRGPPARRRPGSSVASDCTRSLQPFASLRLLRCGHWWSRSHASCSLTRANPALWPLQLQSDISEVRQRMPDSAPISPATARARSVCFAVVIGGRGLMLAVR